MRFARWGEEFLRWRADRGRSFAASLSSWPGRRLPSVAPGDHSQSMELGTGSNPSSDLYAAPELEALRKTTITFAVPKDAETPGQPELEFAGSPSSSLQTPLRDGICSAARCLEGNAELRPLVILPGILASADEAYSAAAKEGRVWRELRSFPRRSL
jgi:hypothetical protein